MRPVGAEGVTAMMHELLKALVVVIGAVLATGTGGPVVVRVFAHVDRRMQQDTPREQAEQRSVVAAASRLRGGAWVGVLERLAVYASVLAGFPEGIAVALAIKGLARYPELSATTSGAAERFIIGTFVSVLLACGWAGLAHLASGWV